MSDIKCKLEYEYFSLASELAAYQSVKRRFIRNHAYYGTKAQELIEKEMTRIKQHRAALRKIITRID